MDNIHRGCRHPSVTADICSDCGDRLTAETTTWRKSWRQPNDLELTGAAA